MNSSLQMAKALPLSLGFAVLLACPAGLRADAAQGQTAGKQVASKDTLLPEPIAKALDTATQVEFVQTPLRDVADFLKDKHGIPIQLHTRALENEGIATDVAVTMNLSGISLRSALRLMLDPFGLVAVPKNEVLMITTKEYATTDLSPHIYYVGDLLRESEEHAEKDLQALQTLLTAGIEPKTWKDGGGAGVIVPFRGNLLIVSQSYLVHEQIAEFLHQMRRNPYVWSKRKHKPEKPE